MKSILVTGGTGSFGKAMTTRMLKHSGIEEVVIFSRDELKQHEMRQEFKDERLKFLLGDVRDRRSLERAMEGVDVVFHAAALKQVPTGEYFPMEHILTNVLGTENVLEVADEVDSVKKVVFLSTDKAVYPINTLGLTKGLSEHLVSARGYYRKSKTVFCSVRYGNVMGSRGSVIPLFIQKIKQKQQIPVTDSEMTRFLLSLEDAIDLVLLAIEKGEQGDLFIKKAPAVTIGDLAQALKEIFNSESEIKIIGTRSGEKVHETLATQLELMRSEDMGGYFKIKSQVLLKPEDFFEEGSLSKIPPDYTSENTERLDIEAMKKILLSLPTVQSELES